MECPHEVIRKRAPNGICPLCEPKTYVALTPAIAERMLRQIRACNARESFLDFVKSFWHVVEPTRPLMQSVAVDALCAVLQEAGDRGGRWAISCPPGVSKSLLCSVLFPAWLLFRSDGKQRIMSGSYSWDFATRDADRCRRVIESDEFQAMVGGAWTLRDDARSKSDYWTTNSGRRLVTSVSGKATGERVNVQILDDVLNASDVYSEATRSEAIRWVTEVLPSRLDDPKNATRILIGQRLHPEDPISVAVKQGWRHLVLPALATGKPCELRRDDGSLIWRDERQPGEPLFALLNQEALDQLRADLGSFAFAAQYQQDPVDDAQGIFRRSWFRFCEPGELPTRWDDFLVSMDCAAKKTTDGSATAILVMGKVGPNFYVLDDHTGHYTLDEMIEWVRKLRKRWPVKRVLVEAKAAGQSVLEKLKLEVPGMIPYDPKGDSKESRAMAIQPDVESGCVVLPKGAPWLDAFLHEMVTFPAASRDDRVDAFAQALNYWRKPDLAYARIMTTWKR